jgi:hypothetical protein
MVLASQQISLIFMSRFSRNLVIWRAFPRSSVFCNFLIWAPFLGQPWTNLIFLINFSVFGFWWPKVNGKSNFWVIRHSKEIFFQGKFLQGNPFQGKFFSRNFISKEFFSKEFFQNTSFYISIIFHHYQTRFSHYKKP